MSTGVVKKAKQGKKKKMLSTCTAVSLVFLFLQGVDTLDSVPPRVLALIVLLCAAVLSFVSIPASSLREGLAAHTALVGLFPSVSEFVFLEARHLREAFGASFKLAGIGSLSRVCSYVVLEIASSGESLDAVRVGTHERPLPGVHTSVDIEVLGSVESLTTARELALAGPVGDVDLLDVGSEVGGEREGPSTARMVTLVWPVLVSLPFAFLDHSGMKLLLSFFRCKEEWIALQFRSEQGRRVSFLLHAEHRSLVMTLHHGGLGTALALRGTTVDGVHWTTHHAGGTEGLRVPPRGTEGLGPPPTPFQGHAGLRRSHAGQCVEVDDACLAVARGSGDVGGFQWGGGGGGAGYEGSHVSRGRSERAERWEWCHQIG